ncbi:NAD-dependent epimerase/dehydratase family protein [Patescibacteria group bacterium]|nr:NAD-dependent epimerase/dehydratase family protein [Patescibacteria group bacterium]
MVIAVTGYNGFIGKHLVKYLVGLGHWVKPIDCDVRDYNEISSCLVGVEAVVHLAANMGGVGFFSKHQFSPILDNIQMDVNVIRYCSNTNTRLLFPSSACAYPVYRMNKGEKLSEEMIWDIADPDQMYGMEKLFITRLAKYADFDFRVVILHTIYGEGQKSSGDKAKFPPQICQKFIDKEPIVVWGDGQQTRTFLHVDDAVKMISEVLLANYYAGPVNISHPQEVKINEIIEILKKHSKREDISYDTSKPTGPVRRPVDMASFYKHYDQRPLISVKQGFIKLFKYLKNEQN